VLRVVSIRAIGMAAEPADRVFVWLYSYTDACTLESYDWCARDSFHHHHFWVSQFIEDQLDMFYADFTEWFNSGEFPDIEEQLLPSEAAVFRAGARAPADADLDSIEKHRLFRGLRAVIRHRLDRRSLEQVQLAAALFNWTIEFGLFNCHTESCAVVRVGTAEEVAPSLTERILDRVRDDSDRGYPHSQVRSTLVEKRFLPFRPLLTMLKETMESENWAENQLAVRIFFWIAEMYKSMIKEDVV